MTNQVLERAQCKALIHGSIFPGKNQYISRVNGVLMAVTLYKLFLARGGSLEVTIVCLSLEAHILCGHCLQQ